MYWFCIRDMSSNLDILKKRILVARGLKKADLVLKGGRVVNVHSGEILESDVAISHGTIAGIGKYQGKKEIAVSGRYVLPGFIDSHVHIESSMLTPAEFTKAALPHGTTAVIADPHEIANVLGTRGIHFFLNVSEGLPLDFYFMLPSSVPSTRLETSGATLAASQLRPFLRHPRVLGLAEVMTVPAALSEQPDVLKKLDMFRLSSIDGHAPELTGRDLTAYAAAGISSDHECTTAAEALEKIRMGMSVFIREGTAAKDLQALLPAVTTANSRFFTFATDDLQPNDLNTGSIDRIVQKAIGLGIDPVVAIQMASINPATHFRLRNKGAVLPGYDADMIVIDNFKNFRVDMVFKSGRLVARKGAVICPVRRASHAATRNSVRTQPVTYDQIRVPARSDHIRVIEIVPDRIRTKQSVMRTSIRRGEAVSDISRDILKLIVVERHGATGNIGRGFVKGFGLGSGAIAATVAHDSHNLIAVGVDDTDILKAVREIKKIQGGLVVVNKGVVVSELALPVAGLMTNQPLESVVAQLSGIDRAVRQLGTGLSHPFGTLSFLALPVVPELKLTDRGLVDVHTLSLVDLFV